MNKLIQQPALNMVQLVQAQWIKGIYRLAGCLVMLDKKQHPYWKLMFSDTQGTVCMYMFTQPDCLHQLAHGVFVDVEAQVKTLGDKQYMSVNKLVPVKAVTINHQFALTTLPCCHAPLLQYLGRLKQLIEQIESQALITFLAQVLVPLDVCLRFIQAPASLNFHHNYPGGLLAHSVEVGEIINNLPFETQVERDLAITGALLHDIGKIKSMNARMKRMETGKWVDHDSLTLEICSKALAYLEQNNSLFANQLRHIWTCASPNARYGFKSKLLIADAIQFADRFSARCG